MTPEVGRRFGPYEIQGRLGSGGMGAVFRAWDGRLMREVALKVLHDDLTMPGMRERFLREARAASALNHPNICTIFDIGEQDGDPYLVMELLEGETVKARVAQGALPVEELIRYAQEIASALGAAHARGIIHRDIKPANIFLVDLHNGTRQAKVLDFGLAKYERGSNSSETMGLTSTGATVGTVAYMSPEQARGESLDARSDLFSLGVVLYEMATRQVPFQGTTSALIFVQLLSQQPEPVRDWNDAIPKDLEKIIHKLLAKERKERFQSATELYEALGKISGKAGGGGWLKKTPPAQAVPLVRAADPVARMRRPLKRPSGAYAPVHYEANRDYAPPSQPARPVADPNFLRPASLRAASEPSLQAAAAPSAAPPATLTPVPPTVTPAPPSVIRPAVLAPPATPASPSSGVPAYSAAAAEAVNTGTSHKVPPESVAARPVASSSGSAPYMPPVRDPQSGASVVREQGYASKRMIYSEPEEEEEEDDYEPASDLPAGRIKREQRARRIKIAAAVVVLGLLGGAYFWWQNRARFSPLLQQHDALLITTIQNKTGDETLNGAINEGLAIQLRQSPYLTIRGIEAYEAGLRLLGVEGNQDPTLPGKVAQRVGAKVYLTGEVSGAGPYALTLAVLEVASNQKLVSVDETAASRDQISDALGRASDAVRSGLGETGDSISRTDVALRREGTSSVEALHALAMAEAATPYGRSAEALTNFQKAVALDPKFVQAQMGLAWAYRRQNAELAAAEAARQAQDAADGASDRVKLLAQYTYEINVSGDYNPALALAKQILAVAPTDPEGLEAASRVLRLEGHLGDALQQAQAEIEADPYRPEGYEQAELAMLGVNRYDAALQMEGQAQRAGLVHSGSHLLASYLVGRGDDAVAQFQRTQGSSLPLAEGADNAVYLDNTGQLTLGHTSWTSLAARIAMVPGLDSAAAYLLAQAALNRGLAGDCAPAVDLARAAAARGEGMQALYAGAMAEAMCGDSDDAQKAVDRLAQTYPQSTAVTGYYLPDLNAAILLRAGDAPAALDALNSARPYDLISLTPYLRGLAHVATRDTKLGLVDFQIVLAHRGIDALNKNDVYPLAQLGEARAFAQSGDTGNAATAYRKFLALWPDGDVRLPAMVEARNGAR